MANISSSDLIAKFQYALNNHFGYILNTAGEKWTAEKQKNTKIENAKLYGAQWIGHYVADCSGLFAWAFKQLGGYMYHGSNTMWNKYCTAKGDLINGKRSDGKTLKPGTAVFVVKNKTDRSHVGLYIGNGKVIEASGTKTGVIMTEITNKKWGEWGELKGVNYNNNSQQTISSSEKDTNSAVVNDTKVALRAGPSTSSEVLTRVDKGERVQILQDNTWTKVKYMGKTGYMMTKFLNTI